MPTLKDKLRFENIPSRDVFEEFTIKVYFDNHLLATLYCNNEFDRVLIFDSEIEDFAKYLSLDKKQIRMLVKEYLSEQGYTV